MPLYDPRPTAPRRKPVNSPYVPPGHQDRPWEPGQPTTGPGAPGSPDPGPPMPPPPGVPGAPPTAPAPPPPIDWAALIAQDPSYIARLAELTRLRHDALVSFGDASGVPGADASTAAEASNNPYSVVALLRQQLGQNQRNLTNQANAHGVLFSGTQTQNQSNEANLGVQRQFDARQRLLSLLGGYGDQQQAAYADAYNRLAQNPPVSPTASAAPVPDPTAAAPVAPAGSAFTPTVPVPHLGPASSSMPMAKLPAGYKGLPAGQLFSTQPSARNKAKLPTRLPARYG
jgi:hypothetical protein